MISAHLFTMQDSGWACYNPNCCHNEKYHDNIIGNNFYIKQGVTCVSIRLNGFREIYCRDCIDIVYQQLKPILDSKLWVFD